MRFHCQGADPRNWFDRGTLALQWADAVLRSSPKLPDLSYPGFPIAEIDADGSSVITKHAGTGGLVSTDTVTAQLLYEIGGARYANPDVTLRVDSISLAQDGPDRVRISGVRGEPRRRRSRCR